MDIYFPINNSKRMDGKMSAKLTNFKVKTLSPAKIIGKEIRCIMDFPEGNPIPTFWDKCFQDGTMKQLEEPTGRIYPTAMLGWCGNFNPEDKTFSYIVGILANPDAEVPAGYISITLSETRYGVGTIEGTPPDIYTNVYELTMDEIKKAGLQLNPNHCFNFEWYDERFCQNKEYNIIDLYIPII